MPKASPQGSKAGEQAEVASPRGDKILKGKEKQWVRRHDTLGLDKMGTNRRLKARGRRRWRLS